MTESPLAFEPPELLSRECADENRITLGDKATVHLGAPGLMAHLMTPVGVHSTPPGRGLHPMTGIPLGLAIEAAIQSVNGKNKGVDVLRACNVSFLAPADWLEPLIATARVDAITPRSVEIDTEVRGEESGTAILRARLVLVRVVNGRAVEIQDNTTK